VPHLGIPNPSTHVFIQKTTEIISDLQRFLCLGGGAKSQPERCPRLPTQNGSPTQLGALCWGRSWGGKGGIQKKRDNSWKLFWGWYCWWKKSCTTWDVWNPTNNGIIIILGGAGFQPSTVVYPKSACFSEFGSLFSPISTPPVTAGYSLARLRAHRGLSAASATPFWGWTARAVHWVPLAKSFEGCKTGYSSVIFDGIC